MSYISPGFGKREFNWRIAGSDGSPDIEQNSVLLISDLGQMVFGGVYSADFPGVVGVGGAFDSSVLAAGTNVSDGGFRVNFTTGLSSSVVGAVEFTGLSCYELRLVEYDFSFAYLALAIFESDGATFDPFTVFNTPPGGNSADYVLNDSTLSTADGTSVFPQIALNDVIGFVYDPNPGPGLVSVYLNGNLEAVFEPLSANFRAAVANQVLF